MSEKERKELSEQETSEVSGSGFGDLFKRKKNTPQPQPVSNPNENAIIDLKVVKDPGYTLEGVCKKCGQVRKLNDMLKVCWPCLLDIMTNTPHPPMSTE